MFGATGDQPEILQSFGASTDARRNYEARPVVQPE